MATFDHFSGVPSETRPIVEAARRAIESVAPKGSEEVACEMKRPRSPSMMWKLVRYTAGGETVVTIGTFTRHAAIFFTRGAELEDEQGVLEGGGKVLRYITLRSPSDVKGNAVRSLIRRAFELAEPPARVAPAKRKAAKKRGSVVRRG